MLNLIVRNHITVIGKFNGNETTVEQEIGAVCQLVARAEEDDIDFFRAHGQRAFRQVESGTAREKNRYYTTAAKKILFISSKSRELIGAPLVVRKVEKHDQEEMMRLAEEFSDTLQYLADEARAKH